MLKFLFRVNWLFTLCVFVLALDQNPCTAQSSSESSGQQATAANPLVSSDVMQELEAMKKRIEQLESELKTRTVQEHPAAGITRESKTPLSLPTTPAEAPAPFAFGDFTWLNGNPQP